LLSGRIKAENIVKSNTNVIYRVRFFGKRHNIIVRSDGQFMMNICIESPDHIEVFIIHNKATEGMRSYLLFMVKDCNKVSRKIKQRVAFAVDKLAF
jgi:hypothetical protein